MRSVYLLLVFFASTSVHAVTVDFESDISNETIQGFSSKGFDFVGNANFWDLSGGVATTYEDGSIMLDNITVHSALVPIPAAVWLFGSALGGLGWMRRRKTV